jgi:hypothetical protein
VSAVVRDIDDTTAGVYQIVENVHRRSLSPSVLSGIASDASLDMSESLGRGCCWSRTVSMAVLRGRR